MMFRCAIPTITRLSGSSTKFNVARSLFSTVVDAKPPKISIVQHPFSLTDQPLPDVTPASDRFAVIEFSGTQYKLTLDDTFVANKMEGIDIGEVISLDKVLLVGSKKTTIVGQPLVPGVTVKAAVEEMAKDKKVHIFKMRRRKNSKRLRGYRRQVTILRVVDIVVPEEENKLL